MRAADPFSCLLVNAPALADPQGAVGLHQPAQVAMHKARPPGADAPEDPTFSSDDVHLAIAGLGVVCHRNPYELSRMVNTVPNTFRVAEYFTRAPASPSSDLLAKRP